MVGKGKGKEGGERGRREGRREGRFMRYDMICSFSV